MKPLTLSTRISRVASGGREFRVIRAERLSRHLYVHADDVAQAFALAIEHHDAASGEDFNVVAPTALTVRGFAQLAAGWFGQTATLEPVTWEAFRTTTSAEYGEQSWDHLSRSQCLSIDKAKTLLGYAPVYEPEAAVLESVRWLIEHGELAVARPLAV